MPRNNIKEEYIKEPTFSLNIGCIPFLCFIGNYWLTNWLYYNLNWLYSHTHPNSINNLDLSWWLLFFISLITNIFTLLFNLVVWFYKVFFV